MSTIPDDLIYLLKKVKQLVVLTGSGVSAESGIPTSRDALTGLWERFGAEQLATWRAFQHDPELVWGWYEWRRAQAMSAEPNAAHLAIAALGSRLPELTLVTQNVDDPHERAGSSHVTHLHGSLFAPRCLSCSSPYVLPAGIPCEPEGGRRIRPPKCDHCGGPVRPGVVWFGEHLPPTAWKRASSAACQCDMFISIGTLSLVYPVANLPLQAVEHGATLVQINPHPTQLDHMASFNLVGNAVEMMKTILERWETCD